MKKATNGSGIKTRLGLGTNKSPLKTSVNRSRKVIQTKTDLRTITKTQPIKQIWSKMKSDLIDSNSTLVRSRLTLKDRDASVLGEDNMQVFIHYVNGGTSCIEVSSFDTIYEVKKKMESKKSIPASCQRIMYCGKLLRDEDRVSCTKIRNYSTLSLTCQLLGDSPDITLRLVEMNAIVHTITINANSTIGTAKDILEQMNKKFKKHKIVLRYGGQVLHDDCWVCFYDLQNDDILIIDVDSRLVIDVVDSSGIRSKITTSRNASLNEFKEQIFIHTHIPPANQHLHYNGETISQKNDKLCVIGIEDGGLVTCMFLPKPTVFERIMSLLAKWTPVLLVTLLVLLAIFRPSLGYDPFYKIK